MILDELLQSIGVFVNGGEEEEYLSIFEQGMALPAMDHSAFHLATIKQKAVSIGNLYSNYVDY